MSNLKNEKKGAEQPESSKPEPESTPLVETEASNDTAASEAGAADDAQQGMQQSVAAHSEQIKSTEAAPPAASGSGGKGWALLAVLIALVALALSSYPYWPWQLPGLDKPNNHVAEVAGLEQELSQLQRQQTALQRDFDDQRDRLQAEIGELRDELQQYQAAVATENPLDIEALTAETEARIDQQIQTALQEQVAQQEASQLQRMTDLQAEVEAVMDERLNGFASELNQRVDGLQNEQTAAIEQAEQRSAMLAEQSRAQLEQMSTRLDAVGQELDATGQTVAQRLLLVQVEALLALGQDRLELDDDVVGASAAFERARARLQAQAVPAFESLEQRIEREQVLIEDYLQDQSELTTAARFVRLNELVEQVPDWPAYAASSAHPESANPESSGWGERFGQALSGLVRIENVSEAAPSAPEVELARERIQQALQSAAMASARQDWRLNQVLIEAAQAEMQAVLNTEDRDVERALDVLNELKSVPDASNRPDLGEASEQVIRLLERLQ